MPSLILAEQPIVFLDIDGPLINSRSRFLREAFDPVTLEALRRTLSKARATLIISSDRAKEGREYIEQLFRLTPLEAFMPPIDVPWSLANVNKMELNSTYGRAQAITRFCSVHEIPLRRILAIDDYPLRQHLPAICASIYVDPAEGMTMRNARDLELWAAEMTDKRTDTTDMTDSD